METERIPPEPSDTPVIEFSSGGGLEFHTSLGEQIVAGAISKFPTGLPDRFDNYDGNGEEAFNTMIRVHIYRIITERSYHELQLHLENAWKIREILGVETVLHHTTYSNSWNDQFDDGIRKHIRMMIEQIRKRLDGYNESETDPYTYTKPDPQSSRDPVPEGAIDDAIKHTRGILFDHIDFDRAENTTHEVADLVDICTDASSERKEFNAVIDDNDHEPALKTLMNAMKNRDADGWEKIFARINDRLLETAKRSGMLDRPVDSYLDITIIPFYPQEKERPEGARGNESKRGTMHGFHFATLIAHDPEHDKDLAVGMVPYTPDKKPFDLVTELTEQAQEHCQLKSMQLDSDFCTSAIVMYLKNQGIEVTTRMKRRGKKVKGALAAMTGEYDDHADYLLAGEANVRVVAEPDWDNASETVLQKEIQNNQSELSDFGGSETSIVDIDGVDAEMWQCRRPYATTNFEDDPEDVISTYKNRWRVENSYADKKRALLAKTQSRELSVRVFVFWLTTVLYNGWMLTRTFLRIDYPDHGPTDRPPVTASKFVKQILGLEYG